MKLLPKIRRVLAVLVLLAITLLFLDFTGALRHWLGWLAKIQFLPAVLALNLVIVAVLVLFTLVLGRSYCSIICPLGIFQDGVSWLSGQRDKRRKRLSFSYKKEIKWLRYGVLALFVVAIILGINAFVAILAPYSAYGRIVTNLFQPVYRWGNHCRQPRELRFLHQGRMAQEPAHIHHRCGHLRDIGDTRLEGRTHILQFRMPGRHHTQFLLALRDVPPRDRQR